MESQKDHSEAITPDNPFGNGQQLKRKFGFRAQMGMAFIILTTWTSMASSMNIALPSGGPVAVIYGLIVSGILTLTVALSLAEICSVYPTNGAQYEWTAVLAPPEYRRFLSYMCGWVVMTSWWALAATGPSLFGDLVVAFIELFNDNYEFHTWHQFLLYSSVEVCALVINTFFTAAIPLMSELAFYLSMSGFAGISIALLVTARGSYQSASFVFSGFLNETGWPDGMAWLLGLLQSCFSLTAYDAVAHVTEEMPFPRKDAPRTMVLAVITGTITALIFVICTLFAIQDIDEVINSGFGPIITIFYQVSGSKGGAVGFSVVIIFIVWFSASEVVTSSARLTAAFARHGGLPFSGVFTRVNKRLDLPLNAMFLTNAMVIVFGLIYLGTSAAFSAIVSACVVGLNISYAIPIALLVFRGRSAMANAEFSLGRFGYAINLIAFLFLAFTTVLFVFPSTANPTGSTMNYSSAALAIVLIFALVYWVLIARKTYTAPQLLVEVISGEPVEGSHEDGCVPVVADLSSKSGCLDVSK